jgi:hypothetical protein
MPSELPKCCICKKDAYPIKIFANGFFQYNFRVMVLRGTPVYQCEECFIEWNKIADMLLEKFISENAIQKGVIVI